jgi:hypothetical protein
MGGCRKPFFAHFGPGVGGAEGKIISTRLGGPPVFAAVGTPTAMRRRQAASQLGRPCEVTIAVRLQIGPHRLRLLREEGPRLRSRKLRAF